MLTQPPHFPAGKDNFYRSLRAQVLADLKLFPINYRLGYVKAAVLMAAYIAALWAFWQSSSNLFLHVLSAIGLGLLCLPIVLNIGHESVHNTFSPKRRINRLGRWAFWLLGTSSYFWELRHINSHHAFANVGDWDMDIEQSKIIRLSPQQEFKSHHQYQHFYMPFVFLLYSLAWFAYRDFKDINTHQFGNKVIRKTPTKEVVKLLAAKVFHLTTLFIIPWILSGSLPVALIGFLSMHLAASAATTFILISTHIGEEQEIVQPSDDLPYAWAEHQLRTTADFSTHSKWANHIFGGFNHHVAHHLFPNINHLAYPRITPIIRQMAKEHNLPYQHYDNLIQTSIAHFKRLQSLSTNY